MVVKGEISISNHPCEGEAEEELALLGKVELQFDLLSQTDGGRRLRLDESSWERGS